MKMIFKAVQLLALIFTCASVQAKQIKPLKIGDRVPEIFLAKMLNHKTTSGKLSDFKGKAIILDQWFISCAPCVGSMRHMDSLQKQFEKDLYVIPVTHEKKDAVEQFWAHNIVVKGLKFTQVVEDTLIRSYFPAVSFPQQIFINKAGIVVAITDGQSTNQENVKKLINGDKLAIDIKQDELDFSVRRAREPNMIVRYPENKNKILYYSYFSKYRKEFSGMLSSEVDSSTKMVRITCNNTNIYRLYDFAYLDNSWEARNIHSRIIRRDTKPIKSDYESKADTAFLFCYDLIYPGTTTTNFSKYMIPDLDRFFGLKSHEELSDVPCYVVSPNGRGTRYKEKYHPERKQYYTASLLLAKRIVANDASPLLLTTAINGTSDMLFLFELPNTKRVNLDLRWDPNNLKQMNEDLEKFDLKIQRTTRKRKVIFLEDQ